LADCAHSGSEHLPDAGADGYCVADAHTHTHAHGNADRDTDRNTIGNPDAHGRAAVAPDAHGRAAVAPDAHANAGTAFAHKDAAPPHRYASAGRLYVRAASGYLPCTGLDARLRRGRLRRVYLRHRAVLRRDALCLLATLRPARHDDGLRA